MVCAGGEADGSCQALPGAAAQQASGTAARWVLLPLMCSSSATTQHTPGKRGLQGLQLTNADICAVTVIWWAPVVNLQHCWPPK
jgi:hypothetical protein